VRLRLTIAAGVATLLASIGLYPLFETPGWFGTGFGAVLVTGATGALTRRARMSALLCPLVGLVALLLYLTVCFVPGSALLGVIPTPGSLSRLGRLLGDGWHDANMYAAPVPMLPAIDLLTATGIGLVALLVDFLAVRVRRAALAGLPVLAMYSVPAAVRQQTVSGLAFLLGAGGYLGLLVVDAREHLSGWGRPVFTRRWSARPAIRDQPDASPLAASGRRIGLTAVAIAIVVPLAVPGIEPRGLLGFGGGGGGGTGSGTGTVTSLDPLDPLVSVRRQLVHTDDADVLSYRTTDGSAPDYLRMYSLERFDGQAWTTGPLRGGRNARIAGKALPVDPLLNAIPTRAVTTRITINRRVRGLDVLPAPYPPTKVDIKGDWRIDVPSLTVFSPRDSAGGRSYTVTSVRPQPDYQELETTAGPPASIGSRYLSVPDSLGGDILALATRVTAPAATPYDKAVKLQQWFTQPGNFTYSLSTPPPRRAGALRDFLFGTRTGYCEQFASSMALLARLLGIPSRVGMGYTAGTRQADGSWLVRTTDAHAWPELYFAGIGWLRFEPTPGGGGGQGSASVPDYTMPQLVPGAPGGSGQNGLPAPGTTPATGGTADPGNALRHRTDPLSDQNGPAGATPQPAGGGLPLGWLLAALGVVVLLGVPAGLRRLTRLYRWAHAASDADLAHAAWDELHAAVLDHGLPWRPSDSPRATARRLTGVLTLSGTPAGALARVAHAEERARYARTPEPATTLREDVRVVRAAFQDKATRRGRWRARLLPPSSAQILRQAGSRVLDAFDWLDVATIRRRRRT
jgi:transglutaminase-like putative cysteine protease